MPAPFPIDEDLVAITIAYRNMAYIADAVLPRVPVAKEEFKYWNYPIEETFRLPETRVGRRSQPNEITLTAKELQILEYLLLHRGEVISKTRLAEAAWERDDYPDSNVIEVFVRRLRAKLDPDGTRKPIETLRGRGYRVTRRAGEQARRVGRQAAGVLHGARRAEVFEEGVVEVLG